MSRPSLWHGARRLWHSFWRDLDAAAADDVLDGLQDADHAILSAYTARRRRRRGPSLVHRGPGARPDAGGPLKGPSHE